MSTLAELRGIINTHFAQAMPSKTIEYLGMPKLTGEHLDWLELRMTGPRLTLTDGEEDRYWFSVRVDIFDRYTEPNMYILDRVAAEVADVLRQPISIPTADTCAHLRNVDIQIVGQIANGIRAAYVTAAYTFTQET